MKNHQEFIFIFPLETLGFSWNTHRWGIHKHFLRASHYLQHLCFLLDKKRNCFIHFRQNICLFAFFRWDTCKRKKKEDTNLTTLKVSATCVRIHNNWKPVRSLNMKYTKLYYDEGIYRQLANSGHHLWISTFVDWCGMEDKKTLLGHSSGLQKNLKITINPPQTKEAFASVVSSQTRQLCWMCRGDAAGELCWQLLWPSHCSRGCQLRLPPGRGGPSSGGRRSRKTQPLVLQAWAGPRAAPEGSRGGTEFSAPQVSRGSPLFYSECMTKWSSCPP